MSTIPRILTLLIVVISITAVISASLKAYTSPPLNKSINISNNVKIRKPSINSNIDTSMFSIYNRYRSVTATITWNDGFVSNLEWYVTANIYVVYRDINGNHVASWYVPTIELRKDYNIKEGGFWSGYHVDDTGLLGSVAWWADWGYDDLFFDKSSIHYIPKAGKYSEGETTTWILTAGVSYLLSVQVTWVSSSNGEEEASVSTYSNQFIGIYNDLHGAMEVHSAYPYNGRYADWAVALSCQVNKLEKGRIIIGRPWITVEYDRWNYGGIQYHWEVKDIKVPIDASDLVYYYNNYYDGSRAYYQQPNKGEWR